MADGFKLRIESLSDLVFGLALSIGGIAALSQPRDGLEDILYGLAWFAFSFIILIAMWMTYSKIMSAVHIETPWAMRFNVALLLLVIVEPYLLNILAFDASFQDRPPLMDASSALYALDLVAIWLIMAGLYHIALRQQGRADWMIRERNLRLVDAAVFLVSALPGLYTTELMGIPLRYLVWLLSVPIGLVAGRWIFPIRSTERDNPSDFLER